MTLQNRVEKFFSSAEMIFFHEIGTLEVIIQLTYNNASFDIYKDKRNYRAVEEYFENRSMTMLIRDNEDFTEISLIDKSNGDTLNIKSVLFYAPNFEEFISRTPPNQEFSLITFGGIGDTAVIPPVDKSKWPLKIHGYLYTNTP